MSQVIRKAGPQPIMGADTETHMGYARLLCVEGQPHHFAQSVNDWQGYLNYLLNGPSRLAFWNIRFDIEAILKHFPEQFIKNLLYLTETELQIGKQLFTFKLIPWKVFTIREMFIQGDGRRRTKRIVQCFDAAQFYQCRLQDAAQKSLGKEKLEDSEFAAYINKSWTPWQDEFPRISKYCQEDASLAGELMRKFIVEAAQPPLNLAPKNPISCAWYAKELIRQCVPEVKTIKSIRTGQGFYYARPWKRWDNVGAQCYVGGRFETFQKGTFHDAYNYDINSAYPGYLAELPNPYNLAFVKDYEPEGQWSMVKAEVWIPKELHVGPLPYRMSDNIIFPTGNWTGWFHWDELKNAEKFGVEFDVQKALNGYEPEGKQRPFNERIPEFFYTRSKLKALEDPRELPYKVAMNSVYGVFYEKNERIMESEETRATEIDGHHLRKEKDNPGRFFYPYLAGWITSKTRIQLLNGVYPHFEDLLFFATDGILTQRKLNIPVSKKLGEWSEKRIETARVFGNGIYELDGKMKTRGIKKDKRDKDSRPIRERMKVATEAMIKELKLNCSPGDILIETIEQGPIHLSSAFRLRDYSLKDALTWIEKKKWMNVTECKKRIWPKFGVEDFYEKQISSTTRSVDGNPLNRNPGLVWKGDSGSGKGFANRFLLGKVSLEVHE